MNASSRTPPPAEPPDRPPRRRAASAVCMGDFHPLPSGRAWCSLSGRGRAALWVGQAVSLKGQRRCLTSSWGSCFAQVVRHLRAATVWGTSFRAEHQTATV